VNPLEQFDADRARAFAAQDPMASVCTVANIDARGAVQIRTLVLRNVNNQMAVFVNATSPKWPALQQTFAVQTYWPSVALQYRLQVSTIAIDADLVHKSWHLRPDLPKRMDWFYQQHGQQSSKIESRQALLDLVNRVELPQPLVAPEHACGLGLIPFEVERLDLSQTDGIHDRQHYSLQNDIWTVTTLVP
jgi:pyridoxine/pyridoxamine 5'-phosphate oxidase